MVTHHRFGFDTICYGLIVKKFKQLEEDPHDQIHMASVNVELLTHPLILLASLHRAAALLPLVEYRCPLFQLRTLDPSLGRASGVRRAVGATVWWVASCNIHRFEN